MVDLFYDATFITFRMFRKATVALVLVLLVSGARRGSRRPAKKEERIHRFTNFSCESPDPRTITAELCKVNENSSIDMVINFVKPFEEIYVKKLDLVFSISIWSFHSQLTVTTSVKKNDNFQQLHKTPIFEYCSFFSGAIANPLFKSLVDQVKSDGNMFHACPYHGKN